MGKGALAVIGQGQVSQILMADKEKLLSYVEEAAGVALLTTRREQSLSRLAQAADHLNRLEDIAFELNKQLEKLGLEAKIANEADRLQREMLYLRYQLSLQRVEAITNEIKNLEQEIGALETALAHNEQLLQESQALWQGARLGLEVFELDYREALKDFEAKKGDVRVIEERLKGARERFSRQQREREDIAREINRLEEMRMPQAPEGDLAHFERLLSEAEQQYQTTVKARQQLLEQRQRLETELTDKTQRLARYEKTLAAYESQKVQLEGQQQQLTERFNELQKEARGDVGGLEHTLKTTEHHHQQLYQQRQDLQAQLQQAQQRHAESFAEANALERNLKRTKVALDARQGYSTGSKHALQSQIKGIIGSVADLIHVPTGYEEAIAAALGRRLENIVVEDNQVAQRVLAHVKDRGGFVTLLPLDLISAREAYIAQDLRAEVTVMGMCLEVIGFDKRYQAVISQLLGNTTIIRSLAEAVQLARRYPQRPRFVTLEGDSLENYGAISGGRKSQQSSVLNLRLDYEEALAAQAAAEALLAEHQQSLTALQERYKALEPKLKEAEKQLKAAQQTHQQAQQAEAAYGSLAEELKRRQEELSLALAGLKLPVKPLEVGDLE
ncbi:MAG: hypothetical protein R2865_12875 [Deinococcales bacterium]